MIAPPWWNEQKEAHHAKTCAQAKRLVVYCAECRSGEHGATHTCSCCESCHKPKCQCGWPPRGRKLTARELAKIRRDVEEREPSLLTERILALLDHVNVVEAELEQVRRPLLPGLGSQKGLTQ